MANIIQAAKWMQEGLAVKRAVWKTITAQESGDECGTLYICSNNYERMCLDTEDLLAADWEISAQ